MLLEDIEVVAEHGSPQIKKIAEAMLLYYYGKTRKKRKRRNT